MAGYNSCAETQVDRPPLRSPPAAVEAEILADTMPVPLPEEQAVVQNVILSDVEPPELEQNVTTQTIKLRGQGFSDGMVVLVGGRQCINVVVESERELKCELQGICTPGGDGCIVITWN